MISKTNVNFTADENIQKKENEKSAASAETKVVIAGLSALAAVGVYIATKGRKSANVKTLTNDIAQNPEVNFVKRNKNVAHEFRIKTEENLVKDKRNKSGIEIYTQEPEYVQNNNVSYEVINKILNLKNQESNKFMSEYYPTPSADNVTYIKKCIGFDICKTVESVWM